MKESVDITEDLRVTLNLLFFAQSSTPHPL
jgi:hypothetical protein